MRTPEQKERQRQNERAWIARMTPEEKRAFRDRKNANLTAWLARNPEVRERRRLEALAKVAARTPEERAADIAQQREDYRKLQLRIEQGKCPGNKNCNEPPIGKHRLCLWHWCQKKHQSERRAHVQYSIDDLVAKWNSQSCICPITGVKLIPGENAEIDHIIPMARGGSASIENVRFVHFLVNKMKWTLTDDEFKAFIIEFGPKLHAWASGIDKVSELV